MGIAGFAEWYGNERWHMISPVPFCDSEEITTLFFGSTKKRVFSSLRFCDVLPLRGLPNVLGDDKCTDDYGDYNFTWFRPEELIPHSHLWRSVAFYQAADMWQYFLLYITLYALTNECDVRIVIGEVFDAN